MGRMRNEDIVALNARVDLDVSVNQMKAKIESEQSPPTCARKGCDESARPSVYGCCSSKCAIYHGFGE